MGLPAGHEGGQAAPVGSTVRKLEGDQVAKDFDARRAGVKLSKYLPPCSCHQGRVVWHYEYLQTQLMEPLKAPAARDASLACFIGQREDAPSALHCKGLPAQRIVFLLHRLCREIRPPQDAKDAGPRARRLCPVPHGRL